MPRSILIPILGLFAVILYGTTQAARPTAEEMSTSLDPGPVEVREALQPVHLPPPPAPRLRSEEAAEAQPDSAGPAERDAAAPGGEPPREAADQDVQPDGPDERARD